MSSSTAAGSSDNGTTSDPEYSSSDNDHDSGSSSMFPELTSIHTRSSFTSYDGSIGLHTEAAGMKVELAAVKEDQVERPDDGEKKLKHRKSIFGSMVSRIVHRESSRSPPPPLPLISAPISLPISAPIPISPPFPASPRAKAMESTTPPSPRSRRLSTASKLKRTMSRLTLGGPFVSHKAHHIE
jgi:hypothetical protein